MSKYLVLKFKNAKLFRNTKDTSDYVLDMYGRRKRYGDAQFVEPITVYQISNVIHVLFNERPVPSHREVFYTKIDKLFDKALNSYLKINNPKILNKDTNVEEYITEIISKKKSVFNSYPKNVCISWEIIKQYVEVKNFDWLLKSFNHITNLNPLDYTAEEFREILSKFDISELTLELRKKSLTGLYDYIKDKSKSSYLVKKLNTLININNSIDFVINLNGEILVPVTDEDLSFIAENYKGICTILDGGFVYISGIKDGNEISPEGYTLMSEISTEKYIV